MPLEPIDYERARVQKLQSEIYRLNKENEELRRKLAEKPDRKGGGASAS